MQVRILPWGSLPEPDKRRILDRSQKDIAEVECAARGIIESVRARGDAALVDWTRRFNGADISGMPLRVGEAEIAEAGQAVAAPVREAIRASIENVRRYHVEQLPAAMSLLEVRPGVYAGERATAVPSVGLYAPRGKGSFPSSMYMMGVPAQVAGVQRVVVVSPPDTAGRCDPATLFAAALCGAREIYRVGGVQALAALAYGTESIPPVVKFLGPGNQYVTAAKRLLTGVVDVGLPAGPSESMIIADSSADPRLVALDLMIEAEHGPDSQAILVTPSLELARAVAGELALRAAELPEPRASYVRESFASYGCILTTSDIGEAAEVVNAVAPEHLQIATVDPMATLGLVRHAGEILLGQRTPFSLANYCIGANAVIPTGGRAKTFSPLSVRDFMKYSSVAYLTADGYSSLQETAISLADYEGFAAHAKALRERRRDGSRKD